ncbi:MAG TPA: class I SAM-dependent methyltransferase [Thermoanaerobaculia bacterium]
MGRLERLPEGNLRDDCGADDGAARQRNGDACRCMSELEPSWSVLVELLEAAADALPTGTTIVAPGEPPTDESLPWRILQFEADAGNETVEDHRPTDSASAIVALERNRTKGAAFLALPTPANQWIEELPLFGDHCRSRYSLLLDSGLGMIFDLRRPEAADQTETLAVPEASFISPEGDVEGTAEPTGIAFDSLDALAVQLERLVGSGSYSGVEFRRFEQHGVHVTPVHFYHPLPDTSQLPDSIWQRESELVGIDMNDDEQLRLLREVFPQFRNEYEAFPTSPCEDPADFYLGNGLFDGTDALVLYCMLRYLQPRRVVEVGSGYSTRVAAQAALANGSTEIVCVEPFPDAGLQAGFPGLTTLVPSRVEDLSFDLFTDLRANDVLFIDSSHVARIGGDVTFLFLEVLPRLQPGVVVQVHDIFLPREYRRDWVVDALRFWNEQYVLQAFLAFNSAFRVLLANSYLLARYPDALRETFPTSPWWGGGSFWMQRREGG